MTQPSRMFPFITCTINPLGGPCHHDCIYCWARKLATRAMMKKYAGKPRIYEKQLRQMSSFKRSDFVFVCDMLDFLGDWVPDNIIEPIVHQANISRAKFLFLSKNPKRYKDFTFEENCTLGATIETDMDKLCVGNAPLRSERIRAMQQLDFPNKMVSVEPIMKFSANFAGELVRIRPEFVAVGYDNYHANLPEPKLAVTETLIMALEACGITVYRKSMRERVEVLP